MRKHTPGEWRANDTTVFQDNPLGSVVVIASCGSPALKREERQANACIIATLPRMLEELRDCLHILQANFLEPKHQDSISAVIREAEGETDE